MVTTDTAALRAAAQLSPTRSRTTSAQWRFVSRLTLRRSAELRRLLLETRVEQIITERAERRELRPV